MYLIQTVHGGFGCGGPLSSLTQCEKDWARVSHNMAYGHKFIFYMLSNIKMGTVSKQWWKNESYVTMTYGQVWWPIQQWTHTHTMNTHPEQWAAIYAAAPGEQLGVRCLAQGHFSRGNEGEESAVHSLPPPTIPAGLRLELAPFQLWVQLSNHWATTSPFNITCT